MTIEDKALRAATLRRWIIVVGVVAMIAIAGSSAYDAWRSYRHATADTERELANVGKALSEQVEVSLRSIDVLLLATADWYSRLPPDSTTQSVERTLATSAAELPQVSLLGITDAEGTRRYRSREASAADFDVSDRPYFLAHRDHPDSTLFVSEPIVTRSDGRIAIVLSRRLHDVNHRFSGVVAAVVNLAGYQDFYHAINLGTGSSIALYRDDGTLVLRQPPSPEAIGVKYPQVAAFMATPQSENDFRNRSPIDGVARFVVATRVPDFPLILSVARDSKAVLDPWRAEAEHVAIRTLLIVFLGGLATAALAKQFRRIELGERALRESEERYALALEGANEGHFDWNLGDGPSFVSPQMQRLHGQSPYAPVGTRDAWEASLDIHPDDIAAMRDVTNRRLTSMQLRDGDDRYESEYRVRHADGTWHWLHARGRYIRDGTGTPSRQVGSAIDVTARKNAEAEKDQLERQLRRSQKMEAMGTLAGGIAHDFNNILGAIIGYGELAQQASPQGGAMRRYLDNVMHAGNRAKSLVERILAFSRSGVSERGLVRVQSVIEETLELFAASQPANVRLERQLASGDAAILGDATQLHQVAMNLLTNALHSMKHGGVLTVRLSCEDFGAPRILSHGALTRGPYARLCVVDSGSGIAPEVVERMFDPFFTTKGVGEGTGLGLSLVHGIVADLGGAIDVRSVVGGGTTFAVWLPVSGQAEPAVAATAVRLPRGEGQSVMIVDDEVSLVALTEEMLAELGYEPIGFTSSATALTALSDAPARFDLLLTDQSMPDLTGTALARAIHEVRPDMPVVLMSGYCDARVIEEARIAGIREVLRKPFNKVDLAACLGRALTTPSTASIS